MTNSNAPIDAATRRLFDAAHHWREAAERYFDPHGFRVAINAAIQALRSVTFLLQKQKAHIPAFDLWYEGWRAKLKADTVSSWAVEARNRIVKEGDLELLSRFRVSVISSYTEAPYREVDESPSKTTEDILLEIGIDQIPEDLSRNGYLKLERRWVDRDLPDWEVLSALAHCHGLLQQLLFEAERQFDEAATPIPRSAIPPCMVRREEDRAVWIKISTGETCDFVLQPVAPAEISQSDRERLVASIPAPDMSRPPFERRAYFFFEQARQLLARDGHHILLVAIVTDHGIRLMELHPEDQADKYRMWHMVAVEVERMDASEVMTIGEVWCAPFDPEHPDRHAVDSPERTEAIQLAAISREGESTVLWAPFERINGSIVLGETQKDSDGISNVFAPIQRVWAKARGDAG